MKIIKLSYLLIAGTMLFQSCNNKDEDVPTIVEVEPKPSASFSFVQADKNDPFSYNFTNTSSDFKDSRWAFADDSTSSETSPSHTFLKTGTFNVKLVVLNGEGYWAQREEIIKISAANLIQVNTNPLGGGKINISYETPMVIQKTQWLNGYANSASVITENKDVDIQLNTGQFKEVKLKVITPKGSVASLNLLVSELGIVKDLTTFDNTFSVSHENSGGQDAGEGSKKLIDNNIETKIFVGGVGNNMQWKFDFFVPQLINGYSMTSGNDSPDRDPKEWKVEGSNDGTTWVEVDHRKDEKFEGRRLTRLFTFNNAVSYKIYRFSMLQLNGGSNFQMSEVRLLQIPR